MKRNNSTISQEELIFSTLLYDRAKALGAALGSGSDFNSYVKRAFASYVEDGQPNPTEAWIDSYPPNSKQWVDRYMSDQFKYVMKIRFLEIHLGGCTCLKAENPWMARDLLRFIDIAFRKRIRMDMYIPRQIKICDLF